MFVVEVGMFALGLTIYPDLFHQESVSRLYVFSIFIILLLTLVFANFSEALAEGRGKAQANALRQTQTEMKARRIKQDGSYEMIDASDLKKEISYVSRQVNKSQMTVKLLRASQQWMNQDTGESAPVIKESGGDFDNVIGGTSVASDWLEVEITSEPGHSF